VVNIPLLYTPPPDPSEPSYPGLGLIEADRDPECELYGPLLFHPDGTDDECQLNHPFTLQPNADPELGSQLVLDGVAGFYACGPTFDVSNLYGEET
jgi:hypothetical protein